MLRSPRPSQGRGIAPAEAERAAAAIRFSRTPVTVPASRYTDPAFADLESARVWSRIRQLACRVDHVAEPGDRFEYRVHPYPVIVVCDRDGVLRTHRNSRRQRGNALCTRSGPA